jgi:hypothetical protein
MKSTEYPFYLQLKEIFENLKNDKVSLSNLFYPIDIVKKNPYLENSLYNEFNSLILNQLINFNYEAFLEYNDILFDDIGINEIELNQETIIYDIVKQFEYNSNVSNFLINFLFLDNQNIKFS